MRGGQFVLHRCNVHETCLPLAVDLCKFLQIGGTACIANATPVILVPRSLAAALTG